MKDVHYESIYTHEKAGKLWSNRKWHFVFYKLAAAKLIERSISSWWIGPAHGEQ
jgi:hypothetical protein